MIPKKLHYCRFGGAEKGKLFDVCLTSWKKYCPDREIIEWNEHNIDIQSHPYMKKAYDDKKRAFVSDIARLQILQEYGGVYVDTDMELIKSIDVLLGDNFFAGYENKERVAAGIIGASIDNEIISEVIERYSKNIATYTPIPKILTPIVLKSNQECLLLYPREYFYPFYYDEIYAPSVITDQTYSIHRRSKSRSDLKRYHKLLKKVGLLSLYQSIAKKLF